MSLKGLFSSDMSVPGDRKAPLGLTGAMVHLNAVNMAPLLAITNANTTRGYRSTSVEWVEKQNVTGLGFIISNNGNPRGNVLRFADTSWITENMIFFVPHSGEFMFVTGVTGQVVHVVRGYGNKHIADITPTEATHIAVQRIGTAFHEGSERPAAVGNLPGIPKFNYTQIFRNTWAITRTAKLVEYNLGDKKKMLKRDAAMMHIRDIEMSMLLGIRSSGHQNNQPHRSMDGLYRQIVTNIASPAGGILTKPMMDTFIEVIFSHTIEGRPNRRILICGRHAITLLNRLIEMNTHYMVTGSETFFGLDITTWRTPHGELTFMPHELLSSLPGRRSDIIVLHPDAIHAYYMYEGEEDNVGPSGNTSGVDGDIGGLITEVTMAVKGELTCGIMTGVCDVAPEPTPVTLMEPYTPPVHPGC